MARHLVKLVFPRVLVAGLITVALTILFSLPSSSTHADGSFDSSVEYFFCNQLRSGFNGPAPLPGDPNCTGDFSPGANPDWGFRWDVPKGDYNFSTFAIFMSDGFSIAADEDIDDGAVVAGIGTTLTLGVIGGACSSTFHPDFLLFDSTTDTSNTVDALAEGTPDRFSNLATDGGDGEPGQADANSPAVLQYPSFLNTLLDPDLDYPGDPNNGPLDPISPHARYTGLTMVPPGGPWIFLTILVLEKTQLLAFTNDPKNATHPFARYGRNPDEAGWVQILVLQDPMELVGKVDPISDFCSPLVADAMFLGQVTDTTHGTVNRLTSPIADTGIDGEGTHLLMLYGLSLRDADGDGLENAFDTCPFTSNVMTDDRLHEDGTFGSPGSNQCSDSIDNDGDTKTDASDLECEDPRVTTGPDWDMIDSACDPNPAALEPDFDGDGFLNSQDNCPLAANVSQWQGENSTTYVLAAPDGGFKHDSIGDVCDSEGGGSDTVADGAFLHDMNTDAACIGGVDTTPADGFCDAGGLSADDIDTDGDGFPNDSELLIGTDPLVDCPLVSGSHDAWPADFDINRVIALGDVFNVLPPFFGSSPTNLDTNGDGIQDWRLRADLVPDGFINLGDLFPVLPPTFGTGCTP